MRFGKIGACSISGPIALQVERVRVLDADRALRVADRDVLEAERLAGDLDLARPSGGPPG